MMSIMRIPSMIYGGLLRAGRIFGVTPESITPVQIKRTLVLCMWGLIVIATFSTVALWTSLQTLYGKYKVI